ncbi:MAG: MT-A70 family methyltransferase [Alphaproteobacteria bacterium]
MRSAWPTGGGDALIDPGLAAWPLPERPGKYQVIYADPPWTFATYSRKGKGRSPEAHYDCMSLADIKALPVSDWAAPDCVLLLWTTDPLLDKAMEVIREWGFTYKTVGFCWAKLKKPAPSFTQTDFFTGLGFWTRANPESCLLATRGRPQRRSRSVRKLIVSPRREHSRKPDEVYERIEALCDGPYLELFARGRRLGDWDAWGNQSEGFPDDRFPERRWAANSYPDATDAPT